MALTKVSGDFIQNGVLTVGHLHTSHGITTAHISEGSNLYFTNARVDSRIGDLSTSNLSEGTNLYYTDARADARIALQVGSNLDLSNKSTSDLSEGTNLYYTDTRVGSYLTTNNYVTSSSTHTFTNKSGNISQWTNDSGYITDGNTNWDNSYGFITASSTDTLTNKSGNISQWTNDSGYITGYTETDTLATVTGRGASTSTAVTFSNSTAAIIFGSLSGKANRINSGYETAADDSDIWINYEGYQNSNSYFRDFRVGNGKNGQVALFDGSAGNLTVAGDIRTPIFYDSNDTNYYVDPASDSVLARADINGGANYPLQVSSSQRYMIQARNTGNTVNSAYGWWWFTDTNFNMGFHADGAADRLTLTRDGSLTVSADMRAPIFYDSNNTNYFYHGDNSASLAGTMNIWGGTGGNYGNQLIIGQQSISAAYTLQDTNQRPLIYMTGAYPALTLNHTATTNTAHGPTLQFTFNGSNARQWLFGASGDGEHLDIGYSDSNQGNTNYNPHNGIAGYSGVTFMTFKSNGNMGIGSAGDWGTYGGGDPGYAIDTRGTLYNNTDVRAPIFYDSNNTGYYLDPASLSYLHSIDFGGILSGSGAGGQIGRNHAYDTLELKAYGAELMIGGQHTDLHINYRTCNNGATNNTPTTWYWRAGASNNWSNHNFGNITSNGIATATGSHRSPIFYDSNDTGYYLDPHNISNLNAVTATRIGVNPSGSGSTQYGVSLYGGYSSGEPTYGLLFTGTSGLGGHGGVSGNWATYFTMNNDTTRGWIFRRVGSTNVASITAGGLAQFDDSVRSPIFYDSNDTNYFIDPRTATNGFKFYSGAGPFYLRGQTHWDSQPGIDLDGGTSEFRFSSVLGNLNLRTDGWFIAHDYIQSLNQMYATILYDQNNTGYYVDPASTTSINELVVDSRIAFNGSTATDDGRGIYFDMPNYNTAYAIFRESGSWSSPYPDLRIAFHTGIKLGANAGYNGIRFYTDYDMSSQVMAVNDGSSPIGAGHVYVNNVLQAGSSLRTPIFYDSNNTGYYTDPASGSNVYAMTAYQYQGNGNVGGTGSASWHPSGIYSAGYNWLYGGINGGGNSATNFGDVRANIFYDYNNTSYYVDPYSTSSLNTTNTDTANWSYGRTGSSAQSNIGLNLGTNASIYMCQSTYSSGAYYQVINDTATPLRIRHQVSSFDTTSYTDSIVIFNHNYWRGYVGILRSPEYPLDLNGQARLSGNYTTSDIRLKENVRDNDLGLSDLLQLRTVIFDWKTDEEILGRTLAYQSSLMDCRGFIAQEVEEVVPALVDTSEGEYPTKSIDGGAVTAMMVKAIQEQQAIIDDLKARIEILENQ